MNHKSVLAVTLSILLTAQSIPAWSSPSVQPPASINLPSSLGYISDSYRLDAENKTPEFILIQDLHVNRSVQFAISGILKRLKTQGLLPETIAVEGGTGPIDIASMQQYSDPAGRKSAADYLLRQGEMPGSMHFAVTEGTGKLAGIETDEFYQANLAMFRQYYSKQHILAQELDKIESVLPQLKKDAAAQANADILAKDVEAVRALVSHQVVPDELEKVLGQASVAVNHLNQVLPASSAKDLVQSLTGAVNFYSLALLRNEEILKNTLHLRETLHQETTVLIAGGFHTEAMTQALKSQGFSYVVITPHVGQHGRVDEKLYVAQLLGRHLTPQAAATGFDWAATMVQIPLQIASIVTRSQFFQIVPTQANARGLRWKRAFKQLVVTGMLVILVACGGSPSTPSPVTPTPIGPLPAPSTPGAKQIAPMSGNDQIFAGNYVAYGNLSATGEKVAEGDVIETHFTGSTPGTYFYFGILRIGDDLHTISGIDPTVRQVPDSGIWQETIRGAAYLNVSGEPGIDASKILQFNFRSGAGDYLKDAARPIPALPIPPNSTRNGRVQFESIWRISRVGQVAMNLMHRFFPGLQAPTQKIKIWQAPVKAPVQSRYQREDGFGGIEVLIGMGMVGLASAIGFAFLGGPTEVHPILTFVSPAIAALGNVADSIYHATEASLLAVSMFLQHSQEKMQFFETLRQHSANLPLHVRDFSAAIYAIPVTIGSIYLKRKWNDENSRLRNWARIAASA